MVYSTWKVRVLCPIPKVRGIKDLDKLRPLMFIEVLCKCASGVMRDRHERGVMEMRLLSDMQWAYQRGKSTDGPMLIMSMVAEVSFGIRIKVGRVEWGEVWGRCQPSTLLFVLSIRVLLVKLH